MQLQVVGLPNRLASGVKSAFMDIATSMQIQFDEVPSYALLSQMAEPNTPYFYVEGPCDAEEDRVHLYHRVRAGFPLQFGREVICSGDLLDAEDRIDWRSCQLSREEETASTQNFRKRFKEFDFTLEDDDD